MSLLKTTANAFGRGAGESVSLMKDLFTSISGVINSPKGQAYLDKHLLLLYEETTSPEDVCLDALRDLLDK